jgi:hypothetical protein
MISEALAGFDLRFRDLRKSDTVRFDLTLSMHPRKRFSYILHCTSELRSNCLEHELLFIGFEFRFNAILPVGLDCWNSDDCRLSPSSEPRTQNRSASENRYP